MFVYTQKFNGNNWYVKLLSLLYLSQQMCVPHNKKLGFFVFVHLFGTHKVALIVPS